MLTLLSVLLAGIGNRACGSSEGGKVVGLTIMTLAAIIGGVPALWLPVVFLSLLLFRAPATAPWLDLLSKQTGWEDAIGRASLLVPFAIVIAIAQENWLPVFIGWLMVPVIPAVYYLCGKYRCKAEPVALAEVLVGGLVGLVGVAS